MSSDFGLLGLSCQPCCGDRADISGGVFHDPADLQFVERSFCQGTRLLSALRGTFKERQSVLQRDVQFDRHLQTVCETALSFQNLAVCEMSGGQRQQTLLDDRRGNRFELLDVFQYLLC